MRMLASAYVVGIFINSTEVLIMRLELFPVQIVSDRSRGIENKKVRINESFVTDQRCAIISYCSSWSFE